MASRQGSGRLDRWRRAQDGHLPTTARGTPAARPDRELGVEAPSAPPLAFGHSWQRARTETADTAAGGELSPGALSPPVPLSQQLTDHDSRSTGRGSGSSSRAFISARPHISISSTAATSLRARDVSQLCTAHISHAQRAGSGKPATAVSRLRHVATSWSAPPAKDAAIPMPEHQTHKKHLKHSSTGHCRWQGPPQISPRASRLKLPPRLERSTPFQLSRYRHHVRGFHEHLIIVHPPCPTTEGEHEVPTVQPRAPPRRHRARGTPTLRGHHLPYILSAVAR